MSDEQVNGRANPRVRLRRPDRSQVTMVVQCPDDLIPAAHGPALDDLFTRVLAALVDKGLVTVHRISQNGTRERACAGAASFRREGRLDRLLAEAKAHVDELRALLDDPARSAGLSAKRKAARRRAARERAERVEAAVAQMPDLKARQERTA